jgi:transcriptional regulator with XRE-family HTH domain
MSRRPDQHASPRGRRHPLRPDLDMASIARAVGCSPSHLSDILRGRRRVTPKLAPRLARALNLPVERVVDTIAAWAAQTEFAETRRALAARRLR